MYHRIARVRHDPWGIAVHPEQFEEQMDYVKRHRSAMAMDELVQRLSANTLPADAVAITFDDGYCDNLVHAKVSSYTVQSPRLSISRDRVCR